MSLSKEYSKEDNYMRDSFDYRICDDLCQYILQFLPLEDKQRLEGVSTQFQRTALLSQCSECLDIPHKRVDRKSLMKYKHLFVKYQNLNKISFGSPVPLMSRSSIWSLPSRIREIKANRISNELIELMIENCNNLTHIDFRRGDLFDEKLIDKFFDHFCNKIISLYSGDFGFNLSKAPNIEELTVRTFDSQLSQFKFNRLKRFKISNLRDKDLVSFELFIENNAKTLKYLEINFLGIDDKEYERKLLKIITKSINLVHLEVNLSHGISDNSFTNYWTQIAIKCKKIKSLKTDLRYNERMRLNENISKFKSIKRLDLKLYGISSTDDQHFHIIQNLTNLKQLTHLSLCERFDHTINGTIDETILTDIEINFPKLQSLTIVCRFIASEWTPQTLSRISSLETIALNIENREMKPEIERQLIQNCKKFKRFNFKI